MLVDSTDNNFEGWTWISNELVDRDSAVVAYFAADVLTVGRTRLLIEHSIGSSKFRMRATSHEGAYGTICQAGLTVKRLEATCLGRNYKLERNRIFGRDRTIFRNSDGAVAIRTHVTHDGKLAVEDGDIDIPLLDTVFLTWGVANIDAPRITMRI